MQISIPPTQQPKFVLEHFLANNDAKEVGSQILPEKSSNRSQASTEGFGSKGSKENTWRKVGQKVLSSPSEQATRRQNGVVNKSTGSAGTTDVGLSQSSQNLVILCLAPSQPTFSHLFNKNNNSRWLYSLYF